MNNASNWLSRRGLGGELLAEFLGTMILLLFGDGVVAMVVLFNKAGSAGYLMITFAWGFAVTMGIYVAGTVTGAHLNPAVTFALALRRDFAWAKVVPYWIAQVLGAFIAAFLLFLEYRVGFDTFEKANHITRGTPASAADAGVFFTSPGAITNSLNNVIGNVGVGSAIFDQILGTALLVFLIFAIVDTRNAPPASNMAPFIIGLIVVVIGMSFGADAGYAINPARDFGPRLFAAFAGWGSVALPGINDYFWVPIVCPLIGGAIGAFVYDYGIRDILVARTTPVVGVEEFGETVVDEHRTANVPTKETNR